MPKWLYFTAASTLRAPASQAYHAVRSASPAELSAEVPGPMGPSNFDPQRIETAAKILYGILGRLLGGPSPVSISRQRNDLANKSSTAYLLKPGAPARSLVGVDFV